MKYLYTLFALFITLSLSAQTSPITFDEAWTVNGADWTIREDAGTTVTIDEDAGNKYLKVVNFAGPGKTIHQSDEKFIKDNWYE